MAEPTVVGSTRVSLIPDTSKFGGLLRIELPKAIREPAKLAGNVAGREILAGIRQKLAGASPTVKVGIDLDDKAVSGRLQKLTADRAIKLTAELDDKAATTSLTRLTADRKVKVGVDVDERAAKAKLDGLFGKPITVDVLPKIQQAAYIAAERSLAQLAADRTVKIGVDLDNRAARARIDSLTSNRSVKIKVGLDDTAAATRLTALTRPRTASVLAVVATTQAQADLSALTTPLHVAVAPVLELPRASDITEYVTQLQKAINAATAGITVGSPGRQGDVASRISSYAAAFSQPIQVPIEPRISRLGMLLVARWRARVGEDIRINIRPDIIDADSLAVASALAAITQPIDVPVHLKWDAASAAIVQAHLLALQNPMQVPVQPTFDSSATPVIAAHLDRLRETIEVTIKPIWDAAAAAIVDAHIDRFREPIDVLVRPVWDTTAALGIRALLAQLASPITASIRTDLMGAPFLLAAGLLDRLARRRRAEIDVTVGQGGVRQLHDIDTNSQGATASLGGLLSMTRLLAVGAAGSLPSLASLVSALIQVGPAAALAAPAVTLLGSTLAAIKLGTAGIGDAIKQSFSGTDTSAKTAATATKQVETAQRSLASAQRGVQDAERSLAGAQRDARQAQADLNVARRQAIRDLQDMNAQLKQGYLDQEQAALDVQQAEEDLARVRSDPTATQLQIQQADLALQRAKASVDEQARQQTRLAADTKAANKAGVDGSQQVVQAREKIRQANEQVANQERALQDAHRAVADAAKQMAEAHETAATQVSAVDQAIAKLSPNARAFVGTLQAMAPAWQGMQLAVQDRLFAGIGSRLQTVGTQVLPTVRKALVGAAGALNTMAKGALTAVSNLEKAGTLSKLFDGVGRNLGSLTRIPGQLVTAFAQLSVAAQPAFDRLTKGLASAVDRVMARLGKAFADGSLTDAIETALDVALKFAKVLGDVGSIVNVVFKAASDAGGDFFGVIGAAIKEIRRVLEQPEMQQALTQIFKALSAVAGLLAGALGAALQAVIPVLAQLAPIVVELTRILGPVINDLLTTLGQALIPIAQALGPILVVAAQAVAKLVTALLPILTVIGDLVAQALPGLMPLFTQWITSIDALSPLLSMMATLLGVTLRPVIEALVGVLVEVGQAFGQQFMAMIRLLLPLIPQLIPVVVQLAQSIAQILIAITPLLPQILTLSTQLLMQLLPALLPLVGPLTKLALLLTQLATWVIVQIVVPALQMLIDYMASMRKKLQPAVDAVKWLVEKISGFFSWLYDILLGHSIIPDIVNGAIRWFGDMRRRAVQIFTDLKDGAARIWSQFWGNVKATASNAWGKIRDGFDRFKDGLKTAFRNMRDSIGDIWSGIKGLVKEPVRFWVETVYNRGIVSVWNRTAGNIPGVPDLKPMSLPKGFARGGILPGFSRYRDGDDQLVPMRRGEGVYVSEAMRDPYERARLHAVNQAAMQGRSLGRFRGFADGGIVGDIGSGIAKAFSGGADAARGGLADLAERAFKPVKTGIKKALGSNNKTWPGMVAGLPNSLMDKTVAFIRGKESELGGTGRWLKPVNVPFGTRFGTRGPMWASGHHTGLDFPAKTGTKVVAVDNGTVSSATTGGPYGKHVMINHGGGLSSLYAHMSAMVAKAGEVIGRGDRVGSVGATGNVTGPHLHLEARKNGVAVDPMPYLHNADVGGSGVNRWRGVVAQALGEVHQSLSNVTLTLRRMNQESGGNPKAVNHTDINAALGHPSVGLMQVIRGTFAAYAGKYKKTGPFMYGVSVDPMANIYASMRYALSRYGSLSSAYSRPGGYAMGGIVGGLRINRGLPRGGGYASGGVIRVGGKRIDTGPIAASVGSDFLKALSGTAAQISAAMTKVSTALKNAFKGVKTTLDNKLLTQVAVQNKTLQVLAKSRDEIKAKITAANALATESTASAVQFTALTSLPNGGNTFDASGILNGLNTRLGQLKVFGKNLQELAKRGLDKALLQQIISAGPESGAAYAQALVDATPAQLKDINTAQANIASVTTQFGKDSADAMYDVGANSGKGYLTGLASTQKLIEEQMAKLAKAIQKAIKVELKIKSPSRVLHALGRFTGLGFSGGVEATIPQAVAATKRMAGAVRATASSASTVRAERNTTNIRQAGDRHLHYNATTREVASRQSVLDALAIDDLLQRTVMVGG